jgi:hypothetical protein
MDDSLNRVWKEFGKQTEAGKLLYELYGVRYRPEKFVNYPKPKLKSDIELKKDQLLQQRQKSSNKIINAVNKIDYPNIQRRNSSYRINKIDLIPKRKKETDIKKELNDIKQSIERENKCKKIGNNDLFSNRKTKIENLQDKFMFQEVTVMPKGARLPGIKFTENSNESEPIQTNITKPKFDQNNRREELDYLYDSILKEIDERYAYMDDVKKLGKDMDVIIMGEIKDRLDELKKIQKMINDYDKAVK